MNELCDPMPPPPESNLPDVHIALTLSHEKAVQMGNEMHLLAEFLWHLKADGAESCSIIRDLIGKALQDNS